MQAHLIGIKGGKQNGTDQRLAGTPGAEHHQGDGDPAAAIDHFKEERVEGRHGEECAADRHEGGADHDGPNTNAGDADALGFHGDRIFAGSADRQPQRRAIQNPGDQRNADESQIGQRRLHEQNLANKGYLRQTRHRIGLKRLDLRRRCRFRQGNTVGEIGQACRQQGNADAGDMLRQAERHGENAMQQPEHRSGKRGDDDAGPQITAGIDRDPAAEGTDCHDALNAEIEHPGALADQLAHSGEDQR